MKFTYKYKISIILLIFVLLLCGCGKNEKYEKMTYSLGEYDFEVEVPKNKKYEIRNGFDDANDKKGPLLSKFNLVGNDVRIEFVEYKGDFLKIEKVKNKYGNDIKMTWENYKKYLFDNDFFNTKELQTSNIKINGVDGVEYRLKYKSDKIDLIIRTLNTDNIISNAYINMYIFSNKDNESVEEIVKKEEVKHILDSMKFIKK